MHPELGEGQHLVLARSLADRAPITDASGAPLFTPTEVVNVGVDPGQVTDLPALAAALGSATGIAADEITADVQKAQPGPVRPGHHAAPSGLREDPRPGLRPARGGLPDLHPGARADVPVRRRPARPGRRGHRRGHRREQGHGDVPRYAAGDQLGLSGLQRAFQEQLAGTPGFTVTVASTDEKTG